jgi:pseudouridine synthase
MTQQRLQKIIAQAGIASRRKAEDLILSGAVTVNGKVTDTLGSKADPELDFIKVNGKLIGRTIRKDYYILVNKPQGYICTLDDPEGRPTVMQLVPEIKGLYPVGRLDYYSEGLLLLTNDGTLAHRLTHAGEHAPKIYEVKVQGCPDISWVNQMRQGRRLEDGTDLAPMKIQPLRKSEKTTNCWFQIELHQGKNRQSRKAFDMSGHPVMRLRRTSIASLTLRGLKPGQFRSLEPHEMERLKKTLIPSGPTKKNPGAKKDGHPTDAFRSGRQVRLRYGNKKKLSDGE